METFSGTLNSNIAKEDREMTNKCSLWDFASGQKENLRTYMKKKNIIQVQPMWLSNCSCKQFVGTFENPTVKKILQMQPKLFCNVSEVLFGATF